MLPANRRAKHLNFRRDVPLSLGDEVERFELLIAPHKKAHPDRNEGEQNDDPDRGGQGFGYRQVRIGSCDAERHQRSGCEDENRDSPAQQPACLLTHRREVACLRHRYCGSAPVKLGGDLDGCAARVAQNRSDFLHVAELSECLANGLVPTLASCDCAVVDVLHHGAQLRLGFDRPRRQGIGGKHCVQVIVDDVH